ncbi:4'-phosphopantetheinyl transferase family protein [Streptomyces sp. 8N706]|uniref:4'-phosphopantetheinyl transferase family protein n=1 Tax=Streptomyces sp. 8N706 TaxID=3457416 RepID=UPI003FD1F468
MKENGSAQVRTWELRIAGRETVVALAGRNGPVDERLLDEREWVRARSMPPARRKEFSAGRGLLRRILSGVLGAPPRSFEIAVARGGSLQLTGVHSAVGISVSHTRGAVAAAVCLDGRVGVDVQRTLVTDARKLRGWSRFPAYQGALEAPETERDIWFSRTWAAQEACVKCIGSGISSRPWLIPLDPAEGTGVWGNVTWRLLHTGRLALAVAVCEPQATPAPEFDSMDT